MRNTFKNESWVCINKGKVYDKNLIKIILVVGVRPQFRKLAEEEYNKDVWS
ncbi:hypothetical protein [Caldisericum sp.]|uniref:hypothetical protein n=1 Tax=Caldisericum sp. TaxID=2499687 RepID=UPI003D0A963D